LLEKERFSLDIAEKIISIISEIFQNGVVDNEKVQPEELLPGESAKESLSETWFQKLKKLKKILNHFYGMDQAKNMVKIIGEPLLKDGDQALNNLIIDFSQRLIQPNITINRPETELRKRKAAESVHPIMFMIKTGEMLLREGDRVTEHHLQKIDSLQSTTRQTKFHATSFGATALFGVFLMVLYLLNLHHNSLTSGNHNKNLLFLASILIVFILIAKVSGFDC
jgi:cyclic-di-AMP phosphodiesterase PgpH